MNQTYEMKTKRRAFRTPTTDESGCKFLKAAKCFYQELRKTFQADAYGWASLFNSYLCNGVNEHHARLETLKTMARSRNTWASSELDNHHIAWRMN